MIIVIIIIIVFVVNNISISNYTKTTAYNNNKC